jgi:hypothetical protein
VFLRGNKRKQPAKPPSVHCHAWMGFSPSDSDCYLLFQYHLTKHVVCRFRWPRVLRRGSASARLLGLWVKIPPSAWILSFVNVVCCVLSGRGLRDELITINIWVVWKIVLFCIIVWIHNRICKVKYQSDFLKLSSRQVPLEWFHSKIRFTIPSPTCSCNLLISSCCKLSQPALIY